MVFTPKDYWKYRSLIPIEEQKIRNSGGIKGDTHQYHDKIFKEVLSNSDEIIDLIRNYLGFDQNREIKEKDLEKHDKEFITKKFRRREADLLYKVKNREIFILIEHQSTVDENMAERITNMCLEIIESRNIERGKTSEYPLILPIVLYTGERKWNAAFTITEKQKESYGFPIQEYPRYNLIDINNYEEERFIQENTRLSKAMLFEKVKSKEEIVRVVNKLFEKALTQKEKQYLIIILMYSNLINSKFTKEEIEEYQNKLKGGGTVAKAEKFFAELLDDKFTEMQEKGMAKGLAQGIAQGIAQAVKGMISIKMKDEDIKKATNISDKELEKIKKEIAI